MVDLNLPGFVVGVNSWFHTFHTFHTFHAAGPVWVHLLPQIARRTLLGYEVVSRVEPKSPKYQGLKVYGINHLGLVPKKNAKNKERSPLIYQNGSLYLERFKTWGRRELSWHHFTREVVGQLGSQIGRPFIWNFWPHTVQPIEDCNIFVWWVCWSCIALALTLSSFSDVLQCSRNFRMAGRWYQYVPVCYQ